MSPLRTGKIARLPFEIRTQLNRRLQNGSSLPRLLVWLNTLPEVRATMREYFHSRPILRQNLSQWVHGGYQDWLHQQAPDELVHCLGQDTAAFTNTHPPVTDSLHHWTATRLALRTRRINALYEKDPEAADKLLTQMIRDLTTLQHSQTRARREQRQRDHLTFREEQAREKSDSLREKTDADHERWAFHPDNQDRLWQSLCTAYPDEYKYESDDEDTDDESNASPQDEAPALDHAERSAAQSKHPAPSSCSLRKDPAPHPQSGPAASLQNAVTLSEVEGPHPFADPSPASPHAEVSEHSSPSSLSPSHSSPASESEPIFCHTTGTYIHYDDDEATPSPSAPSSSPCHPDPTPLSSESAVHAKLDTFDTEIRILRHRIALALGIEPADAPASPSHPPTSSPPRRPTPTESAKETVARTLWPKAFAKYGLAVFDHIPRPQDPKRRLCGNPGGFSG